MEKSVTDIFILHGWSTDPATHQKWQPFISSLNQLTATIPQTVRVHYLKLPGLTSPLEKSWGLDDYSQWLDQQIKQKMTEASQAQQKIVLIGHSFGGQIAIRYTAQNQKKIAKLILISSSGIRDKSVKAKLKRAIFWMLAKLGRLILIIPAAQKLARKLLYRLAREKDYLNCPPYLRETMTKVINEEILSDLAKIETKTLLIWGKNDPTTPVKNAYLLQKKLKQVQLETIPQGRHIAHYLFPKKVAQIVKKFTFE